VEAVAADWRQFRGEGGSGLTNEQQLPATWGPDENIKWSVEVPGEGWACPIAVDGKVFVATAVSDGGKDRESNTRWEVLCFDAESGELLWKKVAAEGKPRIGTHRDNTYASETPATDGERVLVYFGMTGVFCYNLEGDLLWEKDLGVYPMFNDWGTSSSPILKDGLAFIQVDNEVDSFLVALDADTGEERWRKSRDENSNWGSLVIWENSLRTELVASGSSLRSYSPTTGELYWEIPLDSNFASSSPTAVGDVLVAGSSNRESPGRLVAIAAGAKGNLAGDSPEGVEWINRKVTPSRSSPLIYDGHVYVLGGRGGIISCLDAKTGELVYRERAPGGGAFWGSPYAYGNEIYCPADNGVTYVIKPGASFEVLRMNKLTGRFWASPAIANGSLFIRSENKLYCVGRQTEK
jgi:outer membrane protein assembly factor BamB